MLTATLSSSSGRLVTSCWQYQQQLVAICMRKISTSCCTSSGWMYTSTCFAAEQALQVVSATIMSALLVVLLTRPQQIDWVIHDWLLIWASSTVQFRYTEVGIQTFLYTHVHAHDFSSTLPRSLKLSWVTTSYNLPPYHEFRTTTGENSIQHWSLISCNSGVWYMPEVEPNRTPGAGRVLSLFRSLLSAVHKPLDH